MTIHAIRRVCANRKTAKQKGKPVKRFAPTSATYDSRTFTFRESDWTVSLTMLKGREKFSGKQITQTRDRYSRVRSSLQRKASKGTRSTRRRARPVLKRLSGRERRFQTWLNHTISYRPIQQAKTSNQAIALEDLTGIRERTNELPRSKTERRRSNSWAFYQLRQFLTYKGVKFGVDVRLVDPRYTSKTCHCCQVIGNRQGKRFECLNDRCGWIGDADVNGAKNIATLGVLVNNPGGSEIVSCSLRDVVLRATESPLSMRSMRVG